MARGRMIDKRIAKSDKLAALKHDRSRVLYFMIYPHLDVEGRYSGDPRDIKEDCCPRLPYTFNQIAESLVELHDVGLIILYEIEGVRYIECTRFEDFQSIRRKREGESKIPAHSGITPALLPEYFRRTPSLSLSLSSSLSSSLSPHSGTTPERGSFDVFWSRYPKKEAKQDAIAAYKTVIKTASPEDILKALDGYKTRIDREGTQQKYIKLPATFLRSDRWRDYLPAPKMNPEEFRAQQEAELKKLQGKG
jgi:hypothetical protein